MSDKSDRIIDPLCFPAAEEKVSHPQKMLINVLMMQENHTVFTMAFYALTCLINKEVPDPTEFFTLMPEDTHKDLMKTRDFITNKATKRKEAADAAGLHGQEPEREGNERSGSGRPDGEEGTGSPKPKLGTEPDPTAGRTDGTVDPGGTRGKPIKRTRKTGRKKGGKTTGE